VVKDINNTWIVCPFT